MSCSSLDSFSSATTQRPKILEGLGSRAISLTCFISEMARSLPILGRTIGYIEGTLCLLFDPVIAIIEKEGLCLLSLVDKKIHAVSDTAMVHVPLASKVIPPLQTLLSGQPLDHIVSLLERVRTRGFVGSTADIWVEYEPFVKNKSQCVYNVACKVPCLQVVVLILKDVCIPVVTLASDWLVTHSETKDKHEIFIIKDISTSPADCCDKDVGTDETVDVAFIPNEQKADFASNLSSDRGYTPESTEPPEKSPEEMDEVTMIQESPLANDVNGKFPELTVFHEDEDEQDELSDLFDTWGLGVKAISPKGLESLRTLSLKEATGSKRTHARRFSLKSSKF